MRVVPVIFFFFVETKAVRFNQYYTLQTQYNLVIENWCTTYNFGGVLLRRLNYIKCIHCAIEHLGEEQLPVVGYRSHMVLSVEKCCYSDCVVCSVCKHTFLIRVVSAVVDIKSVGVCEPVGGFHENWCTRVAQ